MKSQKIASAIYLLTSFLDDKEPLKWRLRILSIDLISPTFKDKYSLVKEMSDLLVVTKNAGLITDTNYEILDIALSTLKRELEKPLNLELPVESNNQARSLILPEQSMIAGQTQTNIIKDKISPKPMLKDFGAVSVKKNSRQNVIINVLKRKKEVMLKDISPLIKNCSEKTIQRELMTMVKSGVLQKIGDKRWSRYTLV